MALLYSYCNTTDFKFILPYFQVPIDDRITFHYIDTASFLIIRIDQSNNQEVRLVDNFQSFLSKVSDFVNT